MLYITGRLLQVYHQEKTTNHYLYQHGLPAMSEMSLCFWMKLEADDDDQREDNWLVSIALQGTCYIYVTLEYSLQCINNDFSRVLIIPTKIYE